MAQNQFGVQNEFSSWLQNGYSEIDPVWGSETNAYWTTEAIATKLAAKWPGSNPKPRPH